MTLTDNTPTGPVEITAEELRFRAECERQKSGPSYACWDLLSAANTIEALQAKVTELEGHIEDFGIEEERFDGECWNALKYVLTNTPGFDWSNYDPGIQSAEAVEFLIGNIQETKNAIEKLSQERDQARAEVAALNKADDFVLSRIWAAWNELNAIRARDGVPYTSGGYKSSVDEGYFSEVVDALYAILGHDAAPWPAKRWLGHDGRFDLSSTNLAAAKADSSQIADQVSDAKPFSHESKSGTPDPRDARAYGSGGTSANPSTKDHRGGEGGPGSAHNYPGGGGPKVHALAEREHLQATIAMQREAISAAEVDLDGIASDIQKGAAVPGNGTLNFAMQIQARLSKALSTPPSDFIEQIKREEREACENILKRRIVGWCIGASQSFHAPRKAAQCKAIIDELEKVLDFIRARSQELG